MVGKILGHYEILEQLGAGGMGEVYRARDTKLDRQVAIKVLPEDFAADAERLARFTREAKLLASLNHSNIAGVYGLEDEGDTRFIAMELVEGETLAQRIARSGLIDVDEALDIARQIAEALEAAHENGVIHRDLKPANVIVTEDGKAKVLDFGLAKASVSEGGDASESLTHSPTATVGATEAGVLLGTAPYMSPEQATGKVLDKRTDIWAWGCVVFEMLTGKRPFQGENVTETLAAVLKEEPDWELLPADTPGLVPLLLRRCFRKDSRRRLRDIGDARIEIEEASDPVVESGAESAVTEVVGPVVGWTRTTRAVAVAVAVVAMAAGGLATWNLVQPAPGPTTRFEVNLPDGVTLPTGSDTFALSPDGNSLTYVGVEGSIRRLYLRPMDQLNATPIPGTEGARGPFFSPDSETVGFFADGKLKKVRLSGGEPLVLCDADSTAASWGANDTIVFAGTGSAALLKVSAGGGEPETITGTQPAQGELRYYSPEVLPGGEAVLFSISTGGGFENQRIAVLSMSTGMQRTLVDGAAPRYISSGHLVFGQGDSLQVVPFDVDRLEMLGTPHVAVQGAATTNFGQGVEFSVSTTGSLAYVPAQANQSRGLLWVDREGYEEPIGGVRAAFYSVPTISPDGRQVALTTTLESMETWILSIDRGTLAPFGPQASNHIGVWTPDGEWLAFSSDLEGPHNLFRERADGGGGLERLTVSDHHEDPGSWSPDGSTLAFARNHPETGWDIWLLHMDSERRTEPFLATEFTERNPMISPDGRWLAYISNESGGFEVYVQPFPEGGRKWQVSTDRGTAPLWARDGSELFYRLGAKLMVVAVETEASFRDRPRLLFEKANISVASTYGPPDFDITPDGERFLMLRNEPRQPASQIKIVLNWFEELKQLVPTGR